MAEQRRFFFELINQEIKNPVIIKRDYQNISLDEIRLYSSTDFGALLIDGFGDGVWLTSGNRRKMNAKDDSKLTSSKRIKRKIYQPNTIRNFAGNKNTYFKNRIYCLSILRKNSF